MIDMLNLFRTNGGEAKVEILDSGSGEDIWISINGQDLVMVEYDDKKKEYTIGVWNSEIDNDDPEYVQVVGKENTLYHAKTNKLEECEMNTLSEKELNAIAFLVEEGFTHGSIDGVNWEISLKKHDWNSEEDSYEIIGEHIRHGKTMGYYPTWQLEAENE